MDKNGCRNALIFDHYSENTVFRSCLFDETTENPCKVQKQLLHLLCADEVNT